MPITPSVTPSPASLADWSEVAGLQFKLVSAVEEMAKLAANVGIAKHVIEYDSDLRRRALSRAMAAPLAGGSSAAAAEAEARASDGYDKELAVLGKQHQAALQQIEEYVALKLHWETARSLLSLQKESIRQL